MIRERAPIVGSLLLAIAALVVLVTPWSKCAGVETVHSPEDEKLRKLIDELNRPESAGRWKISNCRLGARLDPAKFEADTYASSSVRSIRERAR